MLPWLWVPLCLCSPLYSKCPTHRKCSINRRLNDGWAFFSCFISSLCVWLDNQVLHLSTGRVTSFTANSRKFPGLTWKVQISNIAPMSTVFLMWWLSFSMLPVAYVTESTSLLTSFLMVGPWLAWWGCGTGGVVWRVIDGLGFHTTMSLPDIFWP